MQPQSQKFHVWQPLPGTAGTSTRLGRWGGTQLPEEQTGSIRWRTLAAEARDVAERLSDPNAVRIMLRIAEAYDSLAERWEKNGEPNKIHSK